MKLLQFSLYIAGAVLLVFLGYFLREHPLWQYKLAPPSNMESDIAQIKALTQEFVVGFNSGDIDQIMRFYADTYVDVNLPHPVQSKIERAEYYRKIITSGYEKVDVTPEETIVSGDYAFVRGSLVIHDTRPETKRPKTNLRYIEIWRKFSDGWKSIWGMDAELYPE